jgi:flagellar FliL protein
MSDPFIVTVIDKPDAGESEQGRNTKQHHMQIFAALQSRDKASLAAAETHSPLLRSRLRTLFGSQDFSEMQSLDGKQQLAAEAAKTVNTVLSGEGAPPIERVLFTNFVLQ